MSTMTKRSLPVLVSAVVVLALVLLRPSPARTQAPSGRYTIPGDGTVVDSMTTLTWQQAFQSTPLTWSSALAYCQTLSGLPGSGWRLPTVKELATLIDYGRSTPPNIDTDAFPGVPAEGDLPGISVFWTSTQETGTFLGTTSGAWSVYFSGGVTQPNDLRSGASVRCVRP